jgi:2-octaprenyl-6-methoxyphenol hydroxylase
MLAADGVQSSIRKKLQLETRIESYDKTAIICNITPEFKHKQCAYERLTNTGPTALLPFVQNRCGFVWTLEKDKADEILGLSDQDFLKQAQAQFGYRLGKFLKAGKRSSYPLYLVTVPNQVKDRTILIGNAAHSMSPVSAQGLNLAVRDVAQLFDVVENALANSIDIGSIEVLNTYQKSIEKDQSQTMNYTDDLMNWFKLDQSIVASIRSLGMLLLDQASMAKKALFTKVSGYRGNTPKLLRVDKPQ